MIKGQIKKKKYTDDNEHPFLTRIKETELSTHILDFYL